MLIKEEWLIPHTLHLKALKFLRENFKRKCAGAKKTPAFQELCPYSLLYSYILSGHQTAVCKINIFKFYH